MIVLVGSNLNTFGNNGQFETDPSTWGYSGITTVRSSEQAYSGLYSLKYTIFDYLGFFTSSFKIAIGNYAGVAGKTYLAKARVRVNSAFPFGHDNLKFFIYTLNTPVTMVSQRTAEDSADTWLEIESRWTHGSGGNEVWVGLTGEYTIGENVEIGGVCYVDKFEVFEYIETDDEDPDPDPDPEEPDETDGTYLSKNPITLSKTAPEDWDANTNFRIYCDVKVEDVADSGEYNSKLKVALAPAPSGIAIFYLNEAFRDAFKFTPPNIGEENIVRLTDRIKRFKCATGTMIEIATVPDSLEESDPSLVIYGGIAKLRWPTLEYLQTYLPANKKFLTWAPVQKYVDRMQEDYLNFWIYDESIVILGLHVKCFYDDSTTLSEVTSTLPVAYKSLYQIPAGPVNSGAAAMVPEKTISYYELCLVDQDNNIVSEVRTYYITPFHPLSRHLMFLNSLGSYEVIRMTGQIEKTTEYARDVVQRFLPHNYNPSDGEFASASATLQPTLNYSSGFITGRLARDWHEYMQDFLNSSKIFDVTGGARSPINIVAGNWMYADQQYQRYIRFDVKPAYDDQSFTPSGI